MVAGDTTYVKGGVYNEGNGEEHETAGVWFRRSGTESAPIRLLNAPGELPVIDCKSIKYNSVTIKNANGHRTPTGNITIEGFEIRNCFVGIKMYSGYNITISRNWIHHATAQGILGDGKNVLIDRNVISHNGNFERCLTKGTGCNKEHGIYGTGPNWTVTNNLIYDNLSYGVHVAGYEHCPGRVCASGSTTYTKDFADASWSGADGWLIANNTIAYHNYRSGIVLWQSRTTNAKIINNILYENAQVDGDAQGIDFVNSGGGHVIKNNLCYATSPGRTACIGASGAGKIREESGNIVNTANPNFEGAGATISGVPNFKLKAGSPAIDKGQSISQVTWDHQGIKRPPAGAAFEIGAYEFCPPGVVCEQGSPPPNPTGGGGGGIFSPAGPPVLRGPDGQICPSGF